MENFLISRRIGIDAAHRVMTHGSKCRSLHGHRYEIEAFCEGPLVDIGEQTDMVLDFGFLKLLMLQEIDAPCDHGFILSLQDQAVLDMFVPALHMRTEHTSQFLVIQESVEHYGYWSSVDQCDKSNINRDDLCEIQTAFDTKLYVVPGIPTCEYLAYHWYTRLRKATLRDQGRDILKRVRVYETPNCYSDFPSGGRV